MILFGDNLNGKKMKFEMVVKWVSIRPVAKVTLGAESEQEEIPC